MTNEKIITLAESMGFAAKIISTNQVPINKEFRLYCEENRCGQYDSNYSCPPLCGSVEYMLQKVLSGTRALVIKSEYPIESYEDYSGIKAGKQAHNSAMLRLNQKLGESDITGLCIGGSCCNLCSPCKLTLSKPCPHPELRFSCMSAYCIDVAQLASICELPFEWDSTRLYIYGMIVMRQNPIQS